VFGSPAIAAFKTSGGVRALFATLSTSAATAWLRLFACDERHLRRTCNALGPKQFADRDPGLSDVIAPGRRCRLEWAQRLLQGLLDREHNAGPAAYAGT
jgi:hypothetical protein